QVGVMALGTLAAVWTSWKVAGRDLAIASTHRRAVQVGAATLALALGVAVAVLYVLINAAD
ncbi:MAG TPA: hypothetical protein VMV53_11830, partial [Acidimicrobiales bacterium]|nr:hypothetical protein [Acidimicrobiales bacterium]